MATTAAQMAAYLYPEEEDPEGAFNWWLSPCGGTDLVPEDIKKAFGILSQVAGGISSFKTPKNLKKGSGKKGDDGNPHDQSKPRSTNNNNNNNNNSNKKKKCNIQGTETKRMGDGKNTVRLVSCNKKDETDTTEYIVTSVLYDANAKDLPVKAHCAKEYSQACYHYSSAIRVNPSWDKLTCHPVAATASKVRKRGKANAPQATATWHKEHHKTWKDPIKVKDPDVNCQADEYPPFYLLDKTDTAWIQAGTDSTGQLIRYIPGGQNSGAANTMWKGACFTPPLEELDDKDFIAKVIAAPNKRTIDQPLKTTTRASVTVPYLPVFTIDSWGQPASADDGLKENECWPDTMAPLDEGFALLSYDPWYNGKKKQWDYKAKYDPAAGNGS
jgi:hypothetical protein